MSDIKPLSDYVLVEPVYEKTATMGGIILPEKEKETAHIGIVIAVGDGKYYGDKLIPISVSIGDKITFKKYNSENIVHKNKEYLFIKEEDILGILQ